MSTYEKPLFVVGMPRSGTTLIQGILCNTKKYFPMPETHFFVRAAYNLPEKNLSKADRKRIQRKLLTKSRIKLDQEFPDNLNTQKDIFEYLIDQFNTHGLPSFLEKTPRHVFFYSKILEYYPDARFICMVREPKNVVSSQIINTDKPKKSVIRLSILYNKIADVILKIKNHDNVLLIKYENLTNESESTLRNICNFLNISYDTKLFQNIAAPPGIVSEHEFWKQKNIKMNSIQKNNPDKWKNVLDNNQENLVNFITKSHAANFGYVFTLNRNAVYMGFLYDMRKLIFYRELKKVFLYTHG